MTQKSNCTNIFQLHVEYAMENYSTIKRNVLVIQAATWISLKICTWKTTSCLIPFIWHSGKGETKGANNRPVGARDQDVGLVGCMPRSMETL